MAKNWTQQDEVDANNKAFQKLLPQYIIDFEGQYALMHNRKVELVLKDFHDTVLTGNKIFQDKPFSVEAITSKSINLGQYSYIS